MPLSTVGHWQMVIISIISGVSLGCLFDFYRIVRGKNVNKVIVAIEDTLFWILSALTIFLFLLYNNYAFLGVYVYMFMFLGLLSYLKFASSHIYRLEVFFLMEICRIFRIGYKNVSYPGRILTSKMRKKE